MSIDNRDIIVLGASAGGVTAISRLVKKLPADLPASLMIVLHISPRNSSTLHETLCGKSKLACLRAQNGDRPRNGQVFVAVPDRHLRVMGNEGDLRLQVDRGPRESCSRPSIDALFRSAAGSCGPRAIGVLLTGYLDDGVNGLSAIRRAGGRVVVQDPKDAEAPDLPQRAVEALSLDETHKLDEMAEVLVELVHERIAPQEREIPHDLRLEAAIAGRAADLWPELEQLGEPGPVACPHCGGPLWTLNRDDEGEHLRCHVGHAFSPLSLIDEQDVEIERTLHSALRVLEEKARFLRRLAGTSDSAQMKIHYRGDAEQAESEARTLREFVLHQGRES